ncbi:MAG: type II secretion system minor pseudopilin GspK [Methyloprofundus sp.]|nr:type II secretion system minor pseudopilin GspK [Methyloprofundus sp.]
MRHHRQKGIALISAMLVVALTSIVATQIFYQQQINLRRTFNQLQAEKIYQSFINIEVFVKAMLQADLKDNQYDSSEQLAMANDMLSVAIADYSTTEIGSFQARIIDKQACFNLNNLVISGIVQNKQIIILRNLLTQQKIDTTLIDNLIWSLVDWLDSDNEPKALGAEWETYSQLSPPYQAANQALSELNELYAIQFWKQIQPLKLTDICALPSPPQFTKLGRYSSEQTEITPININTASPLLLKSLSDKMRNADFTGILKQQLEEKGFASTEAFLTQLDADNTVNEGKEKLSVSIDSNTISISSQFFTLRYTGIIDNLEQQYKSYLYRQSEQHIDTLYRSRFY